MHQQKLLTWKMTSKFGGDLWFCLKSFQNTRFVILISNKKLAWFYDFCMPQTTRNHSLYWNKTWPSVSLSSCLLTFWSIVVTWSCPRVTWPYDFLKWPPGPCIGSRSRAHNGRSTLWDPPLPLILRIFLALHSDECWLRGISETPRTRNKQCWYNVRKDNPDKTEPRHILTLNQHTIITTAVAALLTELLNVGPNLTIFSRKVRLAFQMVTKFCTV
jgi:hypothetical protein